MSPFKPTWKTGVAVKPSETTEEAGALDAIRRGATCRQAAKVVGMSAGWVEKLVARHGGVRALRKPRGGVYASDKAAAAIRSLASDPAPQLSSVAGFMQECEK